MMSQVEQAIDRCKSHPKIIVNDGDVLYTQTNKRIQIAIQDSNDEGIIWCQNCYNDKVPILTVTLDGIDCFYFCQRCINLLFSFKENNK